MESTSSVGAGSSSTGTTSSSSSSSRPSSASTKPEFDPERCAEYFRVCASHLHDIPMHEFLAACNEIKKIVGTLGTALGIASADISEKVGVINQRLQEIRLTEATRGLGEPLSTGQAVAPGDDRVRETLQWMIADEIKRNVASRNDWSYVSGTRSLLRLMWFLDFVYLLLNTLLENPATSLKDAATTAYEDSLSPHHPWILRKTIHAALSILPTKETFLRNLAGPEGGENSEEFPLRMKRFVATIDPVRQELWKLYKEQNLENLP